MLAFGVGAKYRTDLTQEQMAFLVDLQKGTSRATAAQDASVIGPLIRANLVRWEVDPSEGASRRNPQVAPSVLPRWVRCTWPSVWHNDRVADRRTLLKMPPAVGFPCYT